MPAASRRSPKFSNLVVLSDARRERVTRILAKARAIVTPDVLDDASHSAAWYPLAAACAIHPGMFYLEIERVAKNLGEAIARDATEHTSVRLEHARVLNLLHSAAFISDPKHEPDGWPLRGEEDQ